MEIDDILEEDLLDIFSGFELNTTNDVGSEKKKNTTSQKSAVEVENLKELVGENPIQKETTSKVLEIGSHNVEDFSSLLKELLNNKTIEITIKIKEE
ncbi:MAG: hypothetical protein RBT59_02105 [Arcobacteraceae bacterium]|nr:hypothetical protein [Arcobacteraceae bacterium]